LQKEAFPGADRMFEEFALEERKHQQLLEAFKAKGLSAFSVKIF